MEGVVCLVLAELECFIPDAQLRFRFVKEVGKRFALTPPFYYNDSVVYQGQESEIHRLKQFYDGMEFYRRNQR